MPTLGVKDGYNSSEVPDQHGDVFAWLAIIWQMTDDLSRAQAQVFRRSLHICRKCVKNQSARRCSVLVRFWQDACNFRNVRRDHPPNHIRNEDYGDKAEF